MRKILGKSYVLAGGFAILNVIMYFTIHKFWIGGSSFLPMIGKLGDNNKFLFAFLVNVGVVIGAFISAVVHKEFIIRMPKKEKLLSGIIGGILVGIGITLAPGTCTTAIVIGLPMLSISSMLSLAGVFMGAYIVHTSRTKTCRIRRK